MKQAVARFIQRLGFQLERWIQQGLLHQLLLMAATIFLVTVLGGIFAWLFTSSFDGPAAGLWWAFLRLTDPGYLGDDQGLALRVISTVITVLGYVLFMGSLVAIMTQWLARRIRELEGGHSAISMQGHIVILGWTNRTVEIVAQLFSAEGRLARFLEKHHAGRLRVVILVEEVSPELRVKLRASLGPLWSPGQILLRSGSSLDRTHLERLDIARALVVIVPGSDFAQGGADLADMRAVKTLLSLNRIFRAADHSPPPQVVAEILDPMRTDLARGTLAANLQIVSSDRVIARLLSQLLRHQGVAPIYFELLSYGTGNSLRLRGFPEHAGRTVGELAAACTKALIVGLVTREQGEPVTVLNPALEHRLGADDLLVFVAGSYDDCTPTQAPTPQVAQPSAGPPASGLAAAREHRLLILGWSHRTVALLAELDRCSDDQFSVTLVSKVKVATRAEKLRYASYDPERIRLDHVEADYSMAGDLAAVEPASFDTVLFLASGWMNSSEEADSRTVLGYALLRSLLQDCSSPPQTLVELLDPTNEGLVENPDDVEVISPSILAQILAHTALRPEINSVFEALLGSGGVELQLRPTSDYGDAGERIGFHELRQRAAAIGQTALGLRRTAGPDRASHILNPTSNESLELGSVIQLIVLADSER